MSRPAGGKPHYILHCTRNHNGRLLWYVCKGKRFTMYCQSSAEAIRRAPR